MDFKLLDLLVCVPSTWKSTFQFCKINSKKVRTCNVNSIILTLRMLHISVHAIDVHLCLTFNEQQE